MLIWQPTLCDLAWCRSSVRLTGGPKLHTRLAFAALADRCAR